MQLKLARGRVVLEEPQEFKSFRLVVDAGASDAEVAQAFAGVARFEEGGIAWVSQDALRAWPGLAGDDAWQQGLDCMIEKARPYGWVDDAQRAIRGHVVRTQESRE